MRRQGEAGFTLVEALIAIVILVFGIVAVTNLFLVAINSNKIGSTMTAATELATQAMERVRAIPFTQVTTGGDLESDVGGIAGCDETPPPGPDTNCVVAGNFNAVRSVSGVARFKTRWTIAQVDTQTVLIRVRSEPLGVSGARARAEFQTLRSCTDVAIGCPP